jgi:UDP-2,3-diacylglucosamine pyrophosphatase LpxH
MNRIVVLSDLHIAGGPAASPAGAAALGRFLSNLSARDTAVIMAGDVFDLLHVVDRPVHLDLPNAPALLRRALDLIAGEGWWPELRHGWKGFLDAGGECLVMPGNHDPELHHPGCKDVLIEALGARSDCRLQISREPILTRSSGHFTVVVEHGNEGDPMNAVDRDAIEEALRLGRRHTDAPAGSRFVLEVVNKMKLAVDPNTGRQRFPFLDLLKPEAGVVLLLLYLEPKLLLQHVESLLGVSWQAIGRKLRDVRRGGVLLATAGESESQAEAICTLIARGIAEGLPPGLADSPETVASYWEQFAQNPDAAPVSRATLADHGGFRRYLLRAALRSLSQNRSFFDIHHLDNGDRASIARLSRAADGPRILIRGHSHAARAHVDGDITYFNTGTWMNLMDIDEFETDQQLQNWIDRIERGDIGSKPRLTYVEITGSQAGLFEWTAEGARALLLHDLPAPSGQPMTSG